MSNDFFTASGSPGTNSSGTSSTMRTEFANVETGFSRLASLTGNALKLVRINAGSTAYETVDGSTLFVTIASAAATYLPLAGGTLTGGLTGTTGNFSGQVNGLNFYGPSGGTTFGTSANDGFQAFGGSTHTLGMVTNGTTRATVNSTGEVGIGGVAAAGIKLQLTTAAASATSLRLLQSTFGDWQMYIPGSTTELRFYDGTADRVFFSTGGNVGIGGAPVTRLGVLTNNVGAAPAAWNAGYVTIGPNANNPSGANLGFGYDTTNDIANIMALAPSVAWKKLQLNANSLDFNCAAGAFAMRITSAGVIQDANANELGYKVLPQNVQSGAYTLLITDRGKSVVLNTTGVTIPASVFSGGDAITIYNNQGASQTITQGAGLTLRFGTSGAAGGNRTLGNNGICTVYFITSTVATISGTNLT